MAFLILIFMISIPVLEIAVFIKVGGEIGLWPTIGIILLTAVLGTALLRQQGLSVLFRIRENLEANRMPVAEMFDGVCLVVAGALLLTPGFVTDTLGFILFVPPVRRAMAAFAAAKFLEGAEVRYRQGPTRSGPGGTVIDGEYEDISETDGKGEGTRPQIGPERPGTPPGDDRQKPD